VGIFFLAVFKFVFGPFTSMYVGQYGASGVPLTQVNIIGTGNYTVGYNLPKSGWKACVNGTVQEGLPGIKVSLTFISDDPQAICLAMSNWVTAAQDSPPSGQQYSLLLWDGVNTSGSSIFIPQCEVIVNWQIVRSKKVQTDIPLNFFWNQRDATIQLFHKEANSALITLMNQTGISPF
jgi:hypothetical protein